MTGIQGAAVYYVVAADTKPTYAASGALAVVTDTYERFLYHGASYWSTALYFVTAAGVTSDGGAILIGTSSTPLALGTTATVGAIKSYTSTSATTGSHIAVIVQTGSTATTGSANCVTANIRNSLATGKTIGGYQRVIHVEQEALGTATVTGMIEGIDVETYVESTVTSSSDHYGIYVKTYSDISGSKTLMPLRLEHNGATVAAAFIGVYAQTSKMSYFLVSSNTSEDWVHVTQTVSLTGGGWLKVKLGGYDRYIGLGASVS
jgi:hypothetical protein